MSWLICSRCKSTEEKIIEMDYSRCGLSEIPSEIYTSSRTLEILHLEGNKLKDLSAHLFQCVDLKYLNVSDNEIRCIPSLIAKLSHLQVLIISKNALILESMSPNLDRLNRLTFLDLSMNDLGKVPDSIMSLINLQQLCLNDTGIEYVPANIGRLSNLRVLELRDNHLQELPKSIRRLTNLQRLDVSDNNLSLLAEIGESHGNLTELWINGNSITKLSASITYLKKMVDFDASYNNLKTVPKEIGQWTKITNLILSFNNLTSLPKSIGNLRNLQVLKLESNFLEELPITVCKLNNLEELNLQNNVLTNLPPAIGHLRKLATLILSNNQLQSLPPDIGSCCSLTILNVHHNQLEKLPDEVGHLHKLTTLGLIGNKLSYLPITLSKLTNLKALWLTPNQTQPLIHLQNDQLNTGQSVLTSVLFPQIAIAEEDSPPTDSVPTPVHQSTGRITFSADSSMSEARLSRTPTPHYRELRRLRDALRVPGTAQIKEARVTNLSSEFNNVISADETDAETAVVATPKQPPPYHVAAIYSKNAHLFNDNAPQSPHDLPKKFSQQQPVNSRLLRPQPRTAPVWPFGQHKVCQVIEVELENSRLLGDFEITQRTDGIYVKDVRSSNSQSSKLMVGDKILAFDDNDYTTVDTEKAYQHASSYLNLVKIVTVSRQN